MVWTKHTEFASASGEPCRHKRQKWRPDMRCGTCVDCGSVLLPEEIIKTDPLYKAMLEEEQARLPGTLFHHPV